MQSGLKTKVRNAYISWKGKSLVGQQVGNLLSQIFGWTPKPVERYTSTRHNSRIMLGDLQKQPRAFANHDGDAEESTGMQVTSSVPKI